jgi:adenine-specific DNA methylase
LTNPHKYSKFSHCGKEKIDRNFFRINPFIENYGELQMKSSNIDKTQKLRGGYYTPSDIAYAIIKKLINRKNINVFEPSFGDGSFIKEIFKRKLTLGEDINMIKKTINGTELDIDEYKKFRLQIENEYNFCFPNLYCNDFFKWFDPKKCIFDVVIGNPPFIRYQAFPEPARTKALNYSLTEGVKLNKLTNIWVPFVILSTAILKENGSLGMVVPAELLQVSYAGPLRKYLLDTFETVILFTCNELLFSGAEQETIILFALNKNSKNNMSKDIEIIESYTKKELINSIKKYRKKSKTSTVNPTNSQEKWTKYFIKKDDMQFIRSLENDNRVIQFKNYFSVDVGIVTGKNNFFVINKTIAEKYKLDKYVKPIICRAHHIREEIFFDKNWKELWDKGEAVGLLDFNNLDKRIPKNVSRYLEYGMITHVNQGYKCSTRKEWYKVPSIWKPDAFMFRQIHDFPHLVINNADAVSTDTIHRVKQNGNTEFKQVLFYTYLTAMTAELEGRSYGGGVLELEPSEAEKLLVPNHKYVDFKKLDYNVTRKENGKFLRENSYYILNSFFNFTYDEITVLENSYKKLFNRRISRRKN